MNRPLAALLAAGLARRFEGAKLDRECAGRPLGQWALDALEEADFAPGVIVAREPAPAFAAEAQAAGWRIVRNAAPERGLGHSVALAARAAERAGAGALMLALADMPLVPSAHLAALLHKLGGAGTAAATLYPHGNIGAPAIFARAHFAALARLDGDEGAGALLRSLPDVASVEADRDWLVDVDTQEGLRRSEKLLRAREARR